jgi:hypothetical protein
LQSLFCIFFKISHKNSYKKARYVRIMEGKEMKIRHFLLLVVVVVSSWAVGCAPLRSGEDYLKSGGRAEVRGEMSGVEFSAVVELSENGESVRVEYLAPDALCGMIFLADGNQCEVRLGDVGFVCNVSEVVGFLRPATAFLPQGEANSVQKVGENTVLTYPTSGTLTLSPKGEPLSLIREDINVQVVWWQKGTEESFGS